MGMLDTLQKMAANAVAKIPQKWREAAESRKIGGKAARIARRLGPLLPGGVGLPFAAGGSLVRLGLADKTPIGLAKATGASLAGMAAVAGGAAGASALASAGGAAAVATKIKKALETRPVARAIAGEVTKEIKREVKSAVRPRRRRAQPSKLAAALRGSNGKAARPPRAAKAKRARRRSTKPPSAKQLAARARFAAMARARRKG